MHVPHTAVDCKIGALLVPSMTPPSALPIFSVHFSPSDLEVLAASFASLAFLAHSLSLAAAIADPEVPAA